MEAATETRIVPLEPGDVFRAASALYRWQARKLWLIVAVIVIPAQVVVTVIQRLTLSGGETFAFRGIVYTTHSITAETVVVVVVGILTAVIATGALLKSLVDAYTGAPSRWRESFRFLGPRLLPLLVLTLVWAVLLAIAYAAMFVPGLYLTVAWAVAVPVLMFEATSGLGALNRSRQLVQGRWLATLGELLLGIVAIVVLSLVVSVVVDTIDNANNIDAVLVLQAIGRVLSAIVTYPLVAAITAVIYIDLRGRKEHFDPRALG